MANIPLKSIQFPGLDDTYTVPSNAGELPYNKSATYPDDTVGKELQDKPDADGTIANAEQLTSNIYEEDSVPYNFRTSGGSIDIGDRETDMLVGGTVAWNQLLKPLASNGGWSIEGGVTATFSDGVASISSTIARNGIINAVNWRANHKYLLAFDAKASSDTGVIYGTANGSVTYIEASISGDNQWHTFSTIKSAVVDYTVTYIYGLSANYNIQVRNAVVIDLTALFGSTISDYIYSLEQANAGAGVAWFRKLFPKPYYAYNAGELMSVQASSHDMVGFNAWDEEWESGYIDTTTGNLATGTNVRSKNYIRVVPNTSYYLKSAGNAIVMCWYDADKNYIGYAQTIDQTRTSPTNACYAKFYMNLSYGTTYKNDICINLHWDGERDGEYEAYVKHSYALDSDLTLRGVPKLDASNNLYYDGDTYESDGTVTRKYGVVDLGSLTWAESSAFGGSFMATVTNMMMNTASSICSKYPNVFSGAEVTSGDKVIYTLNNANYIYCKDTSYTDSATFKTAMNGVYLVYELATPTTETADSYTNPQIVDDFGTEEYVDYAVSQGDRDVSIPVGHYTQYMANLKAKLEMSPNSPEGAGDYIVRQTNGENEYVTLASNATIQDIIARLEALENAES